jgi:serine/threonine-protein phosphatase PGAM5
MIRIFATCLLLLSGLVGAAEPPAPATRTIVLVRHGNYLPDAKADPALGPHLSALGVAQAKLVGPRLARLGHFDALYVSPLQRARDTAAAMQKDFPGQTFTVIPDLEECTPPTRVERIMAGEKQADLESCRAQLDRVFSTYFIPALGQPRQELFVCHGNVIRYLVTRALGVDPTAWLSMSIGHTSITRIRIEADGRMQVLSVGDVGHVPVAMQTGASGDGEGKLPAAKAAKAR